MKRYAAIANPKSNHGRSATQLTLAQKLIEKHQPVEWRFTTHPGHAAELANQLASDGYEVIVSVGGDGTLNEVVNGILQRPEEQRPVLGVLPLGSGNDFAINAELPRRVEDAVNLLFEGEARPVDAAYAQLPDAERTYWINSLGFGFSSAVTLAIEKYRYLSGFMMYLAGAVDVLFSRLPNNHVQFTFDDSSAQEEIVMLNITNGRFEGGGFPVAPQAVIDDGKLDYTLTRTMKRLKLLRFVPVIFMSNHLKHTNFFMGGNLSTFSVEADEPLTIHADGEMLARPEDNIRRIEGGILPGAVRLMR